MPQRHPRLPARGPAVLGGPRALSDRARRRDRRRAHEVVATRGRLVRRIDTWQRELHDAYTRVCADRAHEHAAGRPAWGATIEPLVRYGPALLGFMAARIAQERGGHEAYRAERRHQAAWLAERL